MERKPAKTFEDLLVWRKAHGLALAIYRGSEVFPRSETFGLRFQLRKAAVSVPANIAEGFKKQGWRDKLRVSIVDQRPKCVRSSKAEIVYFPVHFVLLTVPIRMRA